MWINFLISIEDEQDNEYEINHFNEQQQKQILNETYESIMQTMKYFEEFRNDAIESQDKENLKRSKLLDYFDYKQIKIIDNKILCKINNLNNNEIKQFYELANYEYEGFFECIETYMFDNVRYRSFFNVIILYDDYSFIN